jgi:glyoxylase-like metal-dependent hydrolase (beta-lactamase superfamily II)
MIEPGAIRRLYYGHFTLPEGSFAPGQKVVVCGYLIDHPGGLVLFDTGIGEDDPDTVNPYNPVRRPLREAMAEAGIEPGDVRIVVNCHLHPDHAGNNRAFPGTPIVAQRAELEAAQEPGYTLSTVADFEGARYEPTEGEADVLPGMRVIPTPGHSPGHQSMVIDTTAGRFILAGQAVNFASNYATARLGWELGTRGVEVEYPEWIERLQEFDPRKVMFAHDVAIWDSDPFGP